MKQFAYTTMGTLSRRARKNAMNTMRREAEEILNTFDYSNYKIVIFNDNNAHRVIIPKPVFALSLIDEKLRDKINNLIDQKPDYYSVVIV